MPRVGASSTRPSKRGVGEGEGRGGAGGSRILWMLGSLDAYGRERETNVSTRPSRGRCLQYRWIEACWILDKMILGLDM